MENEITKFISDVTINDLYNHLQENDNVFGMPYIQEGEQCLLSPCINGVKVVNNNIEFNIVYYSWADEPVQTMKAKISIEVISE